MHNKNTKMFIKFVISLMLIQSYSDSFNILNVIHIPEIKLIYPGKFKIFSYYLHLKL